MNTKILDELTRIANSLERIAPSRAKTPDFQLFSTFIWDTAKQIVVPVEHNNQVPLRMLKGIDTQSELLFKNTLNHSECLPANHALLWGSRGVGKSSLAKATICEVNSKNSKKKQLVMVEIARDDISSLPKLLTFIKEHMSVRFIIFCDDLTFNFNEDGFKAFKSILDGSIQGCPKNALFYVTSNHRHIITKNNLHQDKVRGQDLKAENDEYISLSDRFGLWLGFHYIEQATYLEIVQKYADEIGLKVNQNDLESQALQWALSRGSRSGRVAWQFIQHISGNLKVMINLN